MNCLFPLLDPLQSRVHPIHLWSDAHGTPCSFQAWAEAEKLGCSYHAVSNVNGEGVPEAALLMAIEQLMCHPPWVFGKSGFCDLRRVAIYQKHLHAKHYSNLSDTVVIDDGFISPYLPPCPCFNRMSPVSTQFFRQSETPAPLVPRFFPSRRGLSQLVGSILGADVQKESFGWMPVMSP